MTNAENTITNNYNSEKLQSNSAQIAAQLMSEEGMSDASKKSGQISQQPTEDEDPVLQRLLASQKRQATQNWQQ